MCKGIGECRAITLTEDQDDVVGTSGNDTIKGTDSTLTVFDNIDGGAGTDTIRLTFTDTVDAIAGGVEVANVENVIINAAGEDTTADISGWTGVENVTVNAPAGGVDLTSAATGTVTVDADAGATVEDEAAATITVTAGGAVAVTAGDADITVDAGAAGEDAVSVTAADAGAVVVTVDGEDAEVSVTADSADSVSIDGATGVAIIVDDLGAVTLASAVVLDEDEEPTDYTQVVAAVTTVDNTALDLTLNGADVKLTASDSDAGDSDEDDDLTTLNLTVAASALDNSLNLTSETITDINISGAGNLGLTVETDTITDIDASEATGDISVTIAGSTTNYAGGSGVDTVTLNDLPIEAVDEEMAGTGEFATVIDGGEGDADVIEIDATAAAAAADIEDGAKLTTAITGFEKLSLTGFDDDAVDATLFGIDYVVVAGTDASSEGSVTIANEGTVELTTDLADIALVVDGADADGADAADFSLNVVLTGGAEGIAAGVVTIADVGAIALASNGTADEDGVVAAENSVELDAAAATTLTITGDAALDLTGEGVVFTALETVAAGDFDAGLTIDVSSSAAEDGVTITTGDGDDVITGSDQDDTIVSGDGNDVVMGGAGADTITVGASEEGQQIVYGAASESSGLSIDTIVGFNANDLDADEEATAYNTFQFDVEAILDATFDTTGDFLIDFVGNFTTITQANTALQVQSDEVGDEDITLQFVYVSNDNSIYGDANGNGVIDEGDIAIELTGLVGTLSDNNFSGDYFVA